MTQRIALAVVALIAAVLVLAVVPLGLSMTAREQTSFRDDASSSARSIASTAEEALSDHRSAVPARDQVREAADRGDCAVVRDRSGRTVLAAGCSPQETANGARLVPQVLRSGEERSTQADDRLTTAVPVGDRSDVSGVTVLIRSTDPLHDRILAMWGWLAATGGGALAAAVLLAVGLARWVGRPLRAVDNAAQRLGEGVLEERSPEVGGPPEVRRLAATFNTMAARTEALVHGHRAVVADVSHQLRTPLTALRLRLDLLTADADEETAAELAGAQDEVARLSRLVDGMLAVARAEHSVPRPVPVRVDTVVAERVAAWEPVAEERRVRLSGRCRPPLTASIGAGDLEQVLDNLVANALDAVPEGGRVVITGTRRHDSVLLNVVDDGPGMPADARATAFRRFGNPHATGTGLGLAIVHRLVTANGGTATLEDTPGGGLTVTLHLPATRRGESG
ncbi:sensor histidine kinase [Streptantibioticus silvisoli]|uniref:histidine kinase n=1 Tax=Streptantibioticus silvisoli TaxID=2705255 RepID=A0ABT6W9H4_9ACTN|nr:HAMP domain-containing sensor histidine kinase [Streptantibioticus silvisoli]MDI5967299.1 HAMP domain-containing sensor histidine kinase [Streptantibioticus silvisoli]